MNTIAPINVNDIVRVYSGRPGCGCGCRGNYYEDARNIKRVVGVINSRITEAKEEIPGIFSIEDDRRYYWAYTKESA